MKRIFTITLLAIYLFNLAGYSLFYQYHISKANDQLVAKIDEQNFNENDLQEIKIPFDLPYYNSSNQFERIDGSIELNGRQYNYVKRKVADDTLYLMCLSNIDKSRLYSDKGNYATGANNLPSNNKGEDSVKKNGFSNEYTEVIYSFSLALPAQALTCSQNQFSWAVLAGFPGTLGRPPQRA